MLSFFVIWDSVVNETIGMYATMDRAMVEAFNYMIANGLQVTDYCQEDGIARIEYVDNNTHELGVTTVMETYVKG